MEFTSQQVLDETVVKIQGRIDHGTAKEFETALKPHLDAGTSMIPVTVCRGLYKTVKQYTKEAGQSDDITIVTLKFDEPVTERRPEYRL